MQRISKIQKYARENVVQGLKDLREHESGVSLPDSSPVKVLQAMARKEHYNIDPGYFGTGYVRQRFLEAAADYILEKEG